MQHAAQIIKAIGLLVAALFCFNTRTLQWLGWLLTLLAITAIVVELLWWGGAKTTRNMTDDAEILEQIQELEDQE